MGLSGGNIAEHGEPTTGPSLDELRNGQLQRLRWSVRHAWENVPHYRRTFAAHEVHPEDLRTMEDLARFPFLTKQDFRANYPFGLFAVPRDKVVRIHTSSGTSGKPTVVGYTARDLQTWAQLMGRCIRAAGARTGDIVHVAYDYGLFTGGLGAHWGAELIGCTVIPVSSGRSAWQIELMEDFRPDILMATPSYALNLADAFEARGRNPHESSLRIGIFGAEPWSEATRAALQLRLGLEAFDLYGLAEAIGPGVACESTGGPPGLTLWEDHLYPEVIDPHTGVVLPEGEEGEPHGRRVDSGETSVFPLEGIRRSGESEPETDRDCEGSQTHQHSHSGHCVASSRGFASATPATARARSVAINRSIQGRIPVSRSRASTD